MGTLEKAYGVLCVITMIAFVICIFFCLIRAIKGPRTSDRIVAVNMIGTMTIIIVAILSIYLKESYLLDICLIYAMLSFLAVVVLTKVYMGVHKEQEQKEAAALQSAETPKEFCVEKQDKGEINSIKKEEKTSGTEAF